jgi:hypothetical protein
MVEHLTLKINSLLKIARPKEGDLVLDIGSNDATALKVYDAKLTRIGIDPTGIKFEEYYTEGIHLIPEFFSSEIFNNHFPNKKAKIVTSIAMFYDLEDPNNFVKDIESILDDEGIWHFEQSYMPSMLRKNSYDTICHEHLEFYSFRVVKKLLENNGMKIIDVLMNSINGGSFAVTACKKNATYQQNWPIINWLLSEEIRMELDTVKPYQDFEKRVYKHREGFLNLIESLVNNGKKILGYGASTKGNVLLQFCGITKELVPFIADVNTSKYGCYTPGTLIQIISENEAKAIKPDYFLVLPWHFKSSILNREKDYLVNGGKFIFPFPEIEIV